MTVLPHQGLDRRRWNLSYLERTGVVQLIGDQVNSRSQRYSLTEISWRCALQRLLVGGLCQGLDNEVLGIERITGHYYVILISPSVRPPTRQRPSLFHPSNCPVDLGGMQETSEYLHLLICVLPSRRYPL